MRFLRQHPMGLWALMLLAAALGLQYLGSWYAREVARNSMETEMVKHLEDLGRLAEAKLWEPVLDLADLAGVSVWDAPSSVTAPADPQPDPELYALGLNEATTGPLIDFALRARLERVVAIDRHGRVLYDTAQPGALLEPFLFWETDRLEIHRALRGQTASSPAVSTRDDADKRYYVPVLEVAEESEQGEVVRALLCLVADRTYLAEIGRLERGLWRAGVVLTVLFALIGWLIWRLIQRQRQIERQAAEADRLVAMGTLAAGFAHELRNPMGIIRSHTEELERELELGSARTQAREACDEIVEEIDRMNRLLGRFLDFSRGSANSAGSGRQAAGGGRRTDGEHGVAEILPAVSSVVQMLRSAAEAQRLQLAVEHSDAAEDEASRWRARIEPGRLKQILMNLMLNAMEASPEGGRVVARIEARARQIRLQVLDQGPGIAEKDARRIFEPFFTTRARGAGLGLAVSRQIATATGGALIVDKSPDEWGACFVLTLPRSADLPGGGQQAAGGRQPAAGGGKIPKE